MDDKNITKKIMKKNLGLKFYFNDIKYTINQNKYISNVNICSIELLILIDLYYKKKRTQKQYSFLFDNKSEEQIFKLYADYQNTKFDGEINYPDSFKINL